MMSGKSILENKNNLLLKTEPNPNSKVLEIGPLEHIFPCSRSKILDFLCVFDEYDYSISDISRHSGISFKTALNEVRILDSEGIIKQTRISGKSIMYKLNLESKQVQSISRLATDIAIRCIKENKKMEKNNK